MIYSAVGLLSCRAVSGQSESFITKMAKLNQGHSYSLIATCWKSQRNLHPSCSPSSCLIDRAPDISTPARRIGWDLLAGWQVSFWSIMMVDQGISCKRKRNARMSACKSPKNCLDQTIGLIIIKEVLGPMPAEDDKPHVLLARETSRQVVKVECDYTILSPLLSPSNEFCCRFFPL